MFGLSSDAGTTVEAMLINPNTKEFLVEATSVATVERCRHSFDPKLQSGYVRALAGRYAR